MCLSNTPWTMACSTWFHDRCKRGHRSSFRLTKAPRQTLTGSPVIVLRQDLAFSGPTLVPSLELLRYCTRMSYTVTLLRPTTGRKSGVIWFLAATPVLWCNRNKSYGALINDSRPLSRSLKQRVLLSLRGTVRGTLLRVLERNIVHIELATRGNAQSWVPHVEPSPRRK